jgi:hypothetical protein
MTATLAGRITAGVLLLVYAATLAPDVTLWDSGEFLSAIRSLGVPHPPGTPLFILIGNAWATLLVGVPFALAVNFLSAVVTATACGICATLIARWSGEPIAGVAAGLVGGTLAAVWQSATETEVYACSLLLSVLMIGAAHRFRTTGESRFHFLTVFLFGLAVPLHLSALVAGPAAILFLSARGDGSVSIRNALSPAAAWCVAIGLGTVSIAPVCLGLVFLTAALIRPVEGRRSAVIGAVALVALGASAVFFMLLRAPHDPGINQGNPATISSLIDVVARTQYDVPGLWPRRAPLWIQIGNVVQYADWQVASALDTWPGGSWLRTPWTLVFLWLAWFGARWHSTRDRLSFVVMVVLLLSASLGVVAVLNLRAGPSYGWGVLPDTALHEARERDYFFALAFLIWGLWAGAGIARLAAAAATRARRTAVSLLCGAPLLLNWKNVDRSRMPDAVLAATLGRSILESSPPNAVLLLGGDNDTYAVWYSQQVLGIRRDVVPVTLPLLGADWYRRELSRRHDLLHDVHVLVWRGAGPTLEAIGRGADRTRRPLAVSVGVVPEERRWTGAAWVLTGMVFVPDAATVTGRGIRVDVEATGRIGQAIEVVLGVAGESRDAAGRYVQSLLRCPELAVRNADGAAPKDSLERAGQTHLQQYCAFRGT